MMKSSLIHLFHLFLLFLLFPLSSCYNPFSNEKAVVTGVESDTLIEQPLVVPQQFRTTVDVKRPVLLPPGFKAKIF